MFDSIFKTTQLMHFRELFITFPSNSVYPIKIFINSTQNLISNDDTTNTTTYPDGRVVVGHCVKGSGSEVVPVASFITRYHHYPEATVQATLERQ